VIKMSKGWYGNRYGHSLASRGISVKQIKEIYEFPEVIDYSNPEEMIVAFWLASLNNDFSNFDFKKAFDRACAEVEFYGDQIFQVRKDLNSYQDVIDHAKYGNHEDRKDVESIVKEIGLEKYMKEDADKDEYDEKYGTKFLNPDYDDYEIMNRDVEFAEYMIWLKKEIENPMTLQDKISLMDSLIYMQHTTGSIWDDFDVEELREEFEKKYERAIR